jgi:diguanylate cyclase (GGDEF)-like protein/PAS domain S-box-containing protein
MSMRSSTAHAEERTHQLEVEVAPLAPATLARWFKTTPAIFHSIDMQGRLIQVSDAWLDKFGYRREEVLGRLSLDFLTLESRAFAVREVMDAFYRTGRRENIEYQMVCKDGRVLDVLLSAVLDPGDAEHGSCSLATITDVTSLRRAERKLAESEALYKGLIESQAELVSLATSEGQLCFVNQAYARNYNRQPHELIGTNIVDYVPERFRGAVKEHLRAVCASKQSIESENQIVMPDGQTRWMAWTNRAITDAYGHVTMIHSVGRDIERRVVAEERLKASEARYRMLADHSSDMVFLVSSEGKRIYASPACHKILGWTPEEMLEMTTKDVVHPDEVEVLYRRLAENRLKPITLSYRMRRKEGGFIWVETTSQQVAIEGQPVARLLVVRDIEQRVTAELRLKESEASYRLLADNSSDMVFQLDRDLKRRYVSPASLDILGYEPAELVGRKLVDKCHPDDAERVAAVLQSLLSGEADQQTIVNRRQHRDGRWVWVEAQLRALKDPQTGEISGITGALRDISLRKSIEDRLADANRRLEILAAEDGLTGLPNRRVFDEALAREHDRASNDGGGFALIMIDIDRFKSFNDRYGHPGGDECLKQVARAIAGVARRHEDLVARYGGEEFVALLPRTDEVGASEVAERMRLAVRELALENAGGNDGIVTISAGVSAASRLSLSEGTDVVLSKADQALYRAKNGGRDQVVSASDVVDIRLERRSWSR